MCSLDDDAGWKGAVLAVTLSRAPASCVALAEGAGASGGTSTRLAGPLAALTVGVLAAKLGFACAALSLAGAQDVVSSPLDMMLLAAHCVRATFDSGASFSHPLVSLGWVPRCLLAQERAVRHC